MKKGIRMLCALLLAGVLAGCGSEPIELTAVPAGEPEETAGEAPAAEAPGAEAPAAEVPAAETSGTQTEGKTLSSAVNQLNWRLLETAEPSKNLFFSPYGLENALGAAALGADEGSFQELCTALCIDDFDAFCSELRSFAALPSSETVRLSTANSIWFSEALSLSPDFEASVKPKAEKDFGAELFRVDFQGDLKGAQTEISDWVNEKTEGLLAGYESSVTAETVMDIVNAVYFSGEWEEKFLEDDTFPEPFAGKKGEKETPMMHLYDTDVKAAQSSGISAVSLPYEDSGLVMDVFIPADKEGKDITELFLSLDEAGKAALYEALDTAEKRKADEIALPKFTMDESFEGLKDALGRLGLKEVFAANGSKFPGFAENLYISDIAHRAKVEGDEKGSRAAAVTETVMSITSAPLEEKEEFRFRVDVPFVFTIRNRQENVILFTGKVNDVP